MSVFVEFFPMNALIILIVLFSTKAFAVSNLTIMADNGAALAVVKMARSYSASRHIPVVASFIDRQSQSSQILEGGAADIVITPDGKWIENLQTQGLIDIYSKISFARGRMALVGSSDSDLALRLDNHFISAPLVYAMNYEASLLIGNPEYLPDGKYARQALRSLDALDVLEPYTLYLKDEDEMIEQVTRHGAFAVMNYGRALLLEDARIIDVFPEQSHSPINYYAVVIAGENMEEARKFLKFMQSSEAENLINSSGF